MSLTSLYGGTSGGSAPSTGFSSPTYAPTTATVSQPKDTTLPGSFSFDFTDPVKSIAEGIGSIGQVAGAIGNIGFDNGPKLGDLFAPFGAGAKIIGDSGIPAAVGGAIGEIGKVASAPAQFLEYQNAKLRLQGIPGLTFGAGLLPQINQSPLPADIQRRLAAGENIDTLAHDMVASSRGYSDNLTEQTVASIIADPINLLSAGLGVAAKAAPVIRAAQATEDAAKAAETLGHLSITEKALGYSYLAATNAGSAAVKNVARVTLGPVASGLVRTWGPSNFARLTGAVAAENAAYSERFDRLVGMFNTAMADDVLSKGLGAEYSAASRAAIAPEDIAKEIADLTRLRSSGKVNAQIESAVAYRLKQTAPQFLEMSEAERHTWAIKSLSLALDAPYEASARMLGSKVNVATAQIIDGARYAKAASELDALKSTVAISRLGRASEAQVQAERLTTLAHDTMTMEDAARFTAEVAADPLSLDRWVAEKRVLSDRFLGVHDYAHADVLDYVKRLVAEGALPSEIGKNVPKVLGAWKAKWADQGYRLGVAPEDGWKAILLDDGSIVPTDPFVHFRSVETRVGARNPLGQLSDSLFRAINQRTLVLSSEQRMARIAVADDLGIAPAQVRSIHRQILRESAEAGWAPRALTVRSLVAPKDPRFPGSRVAEIFKAHLSESQYNNLIEKTSPEFVFLRAVEGNVGEVGLTQKLTGAAKSAAWQKAPGLGRMVIGISEGLYPLAKFKWNAFFQAQEAVETPFWRLLRGTFAKQTNPETLKAATELFDNDPAYRWLSEEYHALFLRKSIPGAAAMVADPGIKGRIARLGDIAGGKRDAAIAQIVGEHHEYFQRAVMEIDPEAWAEMIRAAGTTDARAVVENYVRERQTLISGRAEEVEALLEKSKPASLAYNADEETIWQAYKWTMKQAAEQARTTQYFREGRGFLERTLNHPFLGLYPLSYMTKVYAEFARFLLLRPFGLNAPLAGLAALNKVQTAILTDAFAGTGVADFVKKNPKFVNFIDQLLPGIPTGTPVNLPIWLRQTAKNAIAGQRVVAGQRNKTQDVTPSDLVKSFGSQTGTALSQPKRIFDEVTGISDELATYLEHALAQTQANVARASSGTR